MTKCASSNVRGQTYHAGFFWIGIILLVSVKLLSVADLSVEVASGPHDDGLYISRAFYLLSGQVLGPYDARMLIKMPGFSIWIAFLRMLGIPFLLGVHVFYLCAGIYFIVGLRDWGYRSEILLVGFAVYLLNPITVDSVWYRVLRESVAISYLVFVMGGLLFLVSGFRRARSTFWHLLLFSLNFGIATQIREEDRLLFGLLFLFVAFLVVENFVVSRSSKQRWAQLVAFITLPLLVAFGLAASSRAMIRRHYGMPILYELGEGEYPKLIAAIRRIRVRNQNRHIMVSQEALAKLGAAVPEFRPVIDKLPLPGPSSFSCGRFQICDEWTNGWMVFWIKDAAEAAGLTSDMITAQTYFRRIREAIESACDTSRLDCRSARGGLLPSPQLRYAGVFVEEAFKIVRLMTAAPIHEARPKDRFDVDGEYAERFQMVTMTANAKRNLVDSTTTAPASPHPLYRNGVFKTLRPLCVSAYRYLDRGLMLFGLVSLLGLLKRRGFFADPLITVSLVFLLFSIFRVLMMAHVSVFMGTLDPRLYFSTYTVLVFLSALLTFSTLWALVFANQPKLKTKFLIYLWIATFLSYSNDWKLADYSSRKPSDKV